MRFGDQDEPDLIEYRPVSRLAILALALGLLSSLSLLAPLMLAASAVAVVVAILAMQQVKRNRAAMIGRGAAVAGLLASCPSHRHGLPSSPLHAAATRKYTSENTAERFSAIGDDRAG